MKMGNFHKVSCSDGGDYEHLYVYKFTNHVTYSNTKISMIRNICLIKEQESLLLPCCERPCHESYYPYCYSNKQCQLLFDQLKRNFNMAVPSLDRFGREEKGGNYEEDDWTAKLHNCLELNNIKSENTSRHRHKVVLESWKDRKDRLPPSVDNRSLLFQGSPDLIISPKQTAEGNQGIIVSAGSAGGGKDDVNEQEQTSSQESATFQDEDISQEGGTSPGSQGSGRIQIAHQMTTKGYKPDSSLLEKAGELVAALHTSLACRALRMYTKKKKVTSLTAHGLFMHRAAGIHHLDVTLSKQKINVNATQLFDGILSPEILCKTMKYFMNRLEH